LQRKEYKWQPFWIPWPELWTKSSGFQVMIWKTGPFSFSTLSHDQSFWTSQIFRCSLYVCCRQNTKLKQSSKILNLKFNRFLFNKKMVKLCIKQYFCWI
jgi:hypothetical protein